MSTNIEHASGPFTYYVISFGCEWGFQMSMLGLMEGRGFSHDNIIKFFFNFLNRESSLKVKVKDPSSKSPL